MTIKTSIKAGFVTTNHNETQLRDRSLRVKTNVKAGQILLNHNETQAQQRSA